MSRPDVPRSRRVSVNRIPPLVLAAVIGAGATMVPAGCGGTDGPPLSPLAAEGRSIAKDSGCTACHGSDGSGGVGPAWVGLAGSTVELADGTTILADEEFLRRSIMDPDADLVADFTIRMPANNLSSEEVDAVVAYIQELN